MNSRDVISLIQAEGWKLKAVRGSHHQFHHHERPGKVTVQHPRKDIPVATLKAIETQSGVRLVRRRA